MFRLLDVVVGAALLPFQMASEADGRPLHGRLVVP